MLEKAVWSSQPDMSARGTPEEAILSATEQALIWRSICKRSQSDAEFIQKPSSVCPAVREQEYSNPSPRI